MLIKLVKKKASLKEIGHELIEIGDVTTLKELLIELTKHEYNKQYQGCILKQDEIEAKAKLGKVTSTLYNDHKISFVQAVEIMIQDYIDGLFVVYLNGKECRKLDEKLVFGKDNEVVLIRFVMLAGRLW